MTKRSMTKNHAKNKTFPVCLHSNISQNANKQQNFPAAFPEKDIDIVK